MTRLASATERSEMLDKCRDREYQVNALEDQDHHEDNQKVAEVFEDELEHLVRSNDLSWWIAGHRGASTARAWSLSSINWQGR